MLEDRPGSPTSTDRHASFLDPRAVEHDTAWLRIPLQSEGPRARRQRPRADRRRAHRGPDVARPHDAPDVGSGGRGRLPRLEGCLPGRSPSSPRSEGGGRTDDINEWVLIPAIPDDPDARSRLGSELNVLLDSDVEPEGDRGRERHLDDVEKVDQTIGNEEGDLLAECDSSTRMPCLRRRPFCSPERTR